MTYKSRSKTIGNRLGYSDDDLTTPGHDAMVLWAMEHWYSLVQRHIEPWCSDFPEPTTEQMAAEGRRDRGPFGFYAPQIEVPCSAGGWIDVFGRGYAWDGKNRKEWWLAVEVKTSIRSLGELIRQLRQYERHQCDSLNSWFSYKKIVVLTPETKFGNAIESQGFAVQFFDFSEIERERVKGLAKDW